jgi:hypothetical protein
LNAEADLERIGTTGVETGTGRALQGLRYSFAEGDLGALESGSVDICDVVTHHIHHGLVRAKTGYPGKHRTHHVPHP